MENQNSNLLTNDEKRFFQLKYSIKEDYFGGNLTTDEMFIFIWLQWQSNPVNGKFFTSYTNLESELNGKYSKNLINKVMLSLKSKKYIWFVAHRGSRGVVEVVTKDFPLTSGSFLNINKYFEQKSDGNNEGDHDSTTAEPSPELEPINQKFEVADYPLREDEKAVFDIEPGRTPNTDTNTQTKIENDIDTTSTTKGRKKINPIEYIPKTEEEQKCLKIALELRENDFQFMLFVLKKYGIGVVEEAWGTYQSRPSHLVDDPRRYFNTLVRDLGEAKLKNDLKGNGNLG